MKRTVSGVVGYAIHSTKTQLGICSYLSEPRTWCNKVVAIAHNAKAFDSQFILKRAILLKWNSQIILSGLIIISMKMQHLHFLDSISYLLMPLHKFPEASGLSSSSKSWYPHYFNTGKFGLRGPHTRHRVFRRC